MKVRLYIDTADPSAIAEYLGTGLFRGVTCNPVILQAAGLVPSTASKLYEAARDAGAEEVFLQSFGETPDEIVEQALRYRDLGPEIVVKVVGTRAGAFAISRLAARGVPVLMTAAHNAKQAVTAAAAGATYFAPYLDEMNRIGLNGYDQVSSMQRVLAASGGGTKLIMAGVPDTATIVRYAEEGIDYLTVTPALAKALLHEEATEQMSARFNTVSTE